MERFLTFTVSEEDIDFTVGEFLRQKSPLTPRQIRRAKFLPGGIRKNNVQCRISDKLIPGDQLRICLEKQECQSSHLLAPQSLPLSDILYEDEDILAVNKPAGILTHPAGKHYEDTLTNQVAFYFQERNLSVRIRPVGRLDKETSGIVLFAKNQAAAQQLQVQRQNQILQKEYLAIVDGTLPQDVKDTWHTVSFPLIKEGEHPLRMRACSDNFSTLISDGSNPLLSALTYYQVLHSTSEWSFIRLRLETGRTHQIRVHMKALGHSLLGDTLYQNPVSVAKTALFARTALHAWKVTFRQPFSGYNVTLEAPFPDDFRNFADSIQ